MRHSLPDVAKAFACDAAIKVIKLAEYATLPEYAHGPNEDAGMDLCAVEEVLLSPGQPRLIGTGLAFEIPPGIEGQIRPRSGLANKQVIAILNSPGTVDPGYRGEVKVALTALYSPYRVKKGERIAQIVFAPYTRVKLVLADVLDNTQRGTAGFGSTDT